MNKLFFQRLNQICLAQLSQKMSIKNSLGLTDLLKSNGAQMSDFKSDILSNWYILPSGAIPPNPSELLGSSKMETVLNSFREVFDYIIIDLPPVNIVSDAVSVSRLITGMVVIVREEYTEKRELDDCLRQLKMSNVNVLGCVINEAKSEIGSYGKYKKGKYKKYYRYD